MYVPNKFPIFCTSTLGFLIVIRTPQAEMVNGLVIQRLICKDSGLILKTNKLEQMYASTAPVLREKPAI